MAYLPAEHTAPGAEFDVTSAAAAPARVVPMPFYREITWRIRLASNTRKTTSGSN